MIRNLVTKFTRPGGEITEGPPEADPGYADTLTATTAAVETIVQTIPAVNGNLPPISEIDDAQAAVTAFIEAFPEPSIIQRFGLDFSQPENWTPGQLRKLTSQDLDLEALNELKRLIELLLIVIQKFPEALLDERDPAKQTAVLGRVNDIANWTGVLRGMIVDALANKGDDPRQLFNFVKSDTVDRDTFLADVQGYRAKFEATDNYFVNQLLGEIEQLRTFAETHTPAKSQLVQGFPWRPAELTSVQKPKSKALPEKPTQALPERGGENPIKVHEFCEQVYQLTDPQVDLALFTSQTLAIIERCKEESKISSSPGPQTRSFLPETIQHDFLPHLSSGWELLTPDNKVSIYKELEALRDLYRSNETKHQDNQRIWLIINEKLPELVRS